MVRDDIIGLQTLGTDHNEIELSQNVEESTKVDTCRLAMCNVV